MRRRWYKWRSMPPKRSGQVSQSLMDNKYRVDSLYECRFLLAGAVRVSQPVLERCEVRMHRHGRTLRMKYRVRQDACSVLSLRRFSRANTRMPRAGAALRKWSWRRVNGLPFLCRSIFAIRGFIRPLQPELLFTWLTFAKPQIIRVRRDNSSYQISKRVLS